MMGWQECIVALVLLLCVAYTVHRLMKRRSSCCGCPLHRQCHSKKALKK